MDSALKMFTLARELYNTSLANLPYQQQTIVAQLVTAEIQAEAIQELANNVKYIDLHGGIKKMIKENNIYD